METYGSYLIDLVTHIDQIRAIATTNLNNAKVRSKRYHDRNLNEKSFKVGDIVHTLRETGKHKFQSKYLGPYEIVEFLDKNNVILESKEAKRILKHMDKLNYTKHQARKFGPQLFESAIVNPGRPTLDWVTRSFAKRNGTMGKLTQKLPRTSTLQPHRSVRRTWT